MIYTKAICLTSNKYESIYASKAAISAGGRRLRGSHFYFRLPNLALSLWSAVENYENNKEWVEEGKGRRGKNLTRTVLKGKIRQALSFLLGRHCSLALSAKWSQRLTDKGLLSGAASETGTGGDNCAPCECGRSW